MQYDVGMKVVLCQDIFDDYGDMLLAGAGDVGTVTSKNYTTDGDHLYEVYFKSVNTTVGVYQSEMEPYREKGRTPATISLDPF